MSIKGLELLHECGKIKATQNDFEITPLQCFYGTALN